MSQCRGTHITNAFFPFFFSLQKPGDRSLMTPQQKKDSDMKAQAEKAAAKLAAAGSSAAGSKK
jgi:hypothetical protein